MSFIDKLKAKIAYEKESCRMSGEALKQHEKDFPFPPLRERVRMTEADLAKWRRAQRKSTK